MAGNARGGAGTAKGPLDGIKVLDFTTLLYGPYAAQILGDMGADVIKVEAITGDVWRYIGPLRHVGMGPHFLATNRNKRAIAIDLAKPAGREAFLKLADRTDVLMLNLRPKGVKKLGIDYETLAKRNPRLIYCPATGFGSRGPYADRPAVDDLIQGLSGLAMLNGRYLSSDPKYAPTVLADKMSALTLASAVLLAIIHRLRTGEGQFIEAPMYESMAAIMMVEHLSGTMFDPPIGPAGYERMLTPYRRPFRTKDGYVTALPYTDDHWQKFFGLCGRQDLIGDPRFRTIKERTEHVGLLYKLVEDAIVTRTTAGWLSIFERENIPAAAVNNIEDLKDDPHLKAVGMLTAVDHPSEGRIFAISNPVHMTKSPATLRRLAPRLGEHSAEILAAVGYSETDIKAMADDKVIVDGRQPPR
jgi:crotonobetainyl-CoA:carnitine CoA-transferase CaiB-like acyl-CoA transferase